MGVKAHLTTEIGGKFLLYFLCYECFKFSFDYKCFVVVI